MDPKHDSGAVPTRVFTEAEYQADASRVIAHATAAGSAIVARADGSPRVVISIPPAESVISESVD
jgi:hypothetical protein